MKKLDEISCTPNLNLLIIEHESPALEYPPAREKEDPKYD